MDSIKIEAWAARLNTPMHIMDWAQAQPEDPELEATLEWCLSNKKKGTPWAQQHLPSGCFLALDELSIFSTAEPMEYPSSYR